jgi:hypothetical protein
MVSETQSIQQDMQVSPKDTPMDTTAGAVVTCGDHQEMKQKLRFVDFTCSYSEVLDSDVPQEDSLMTLLGLSLCRACDQGRHSKSFLGM